MGHTLNVLQGRLREHAKRGNGITHKIAQALTGEGPRSPHWRTIETRWKKSHPHCAAGANCVGKIQVHHIVPFKHDPSLELQDGTGILPATGKAGDKPNLISLCEGSSDEVHHHLHVGHGGNFQYGNLNVEKDAANLMAHPDMEAAIYSHAMMNRVKS